MSMRIFLGAATLLSLLLFCSIAQAQTTAHADLKNAEGKSVGSAELRDAKEGVLVILRVHDLSPGLHAVHIHAVGKCEGPQFTSAGGHFNPGQKKHGFKNSEGPHAGDLPDVLIVKNGSGRFEAVTDAVSLAAGGNSLFDQDGSAIVIHATADDNTTDPTGNSGDRIACGVIEKGKK
jgi:Cu-Zn family superoxide dismutase